MQGIPGSRIAAPLATLLAALAATAVQAQVIERVKMTDGEMSCRQMHTELGTMDQAIAEAKKEQESGATTTTVGQVGGVAAEVANRTGLFGQIGGLFGHIAGSVAAKAGAGAAEQSGRQSTARAAEREKQALARKEHVTALFLARGCNASNPDAPPANPNATVALLAPKPAAPAQPALPPEELVKQLGASITPLTTKLDLNHNMVNVATAPRVFVPTFRVAFTVKTQASAYAGGGIANIGQSTGFNRTITQAQNRRVEMGLAGADLPLLQAITDRLYEDFVQRLKAAGKEVVPMEAVLKAPGFEKIKPITTRPYTANPTMQGDPREYVVLVPTGLPMFFMHLDSYIGNAGAFDQVGTKAVHEMGAHLNAVAYMPTLHVDIAQLESSGRSSFSAGAEAEVHPKLGIGGRSELRFTNGKDVKIFFTGEQGSLIVKAPVYTEGEFGTVRTVENFDTASLANSLTRATGLQGVQSFVDKRELRVDPRKFAEGVLKIGATFNQQVIAAAK
jgi:hypothetical protein